MPTREDAYDKICELLKPYNPKNRAIEMSSGIMSDLEVDSTAVFDIIMGLEDHYDISIPMEMVSDINSAFNSTILLVRHVDALVTAKFC